MKTISLVCALFTGALIFASCNSGTTTTAKTSADSPTMVKPDTASAMNAHDMGKMDDGLMGSMKSMMDKMGSMKMTGDPDIDFAGMMIEHHQGAIDMSEAEIKSGTDEKLKAMAQNIITKQKGEQNNLRDIVRNTKPMKMDMGQGNASNKLINEMMANMKAMEMSGNTDKDFIRMMISHHESAIKMAKSEIANGMNSSLKQMAKTMINDQTMEINNFKKLLPEIK
ncbi:DUF305 domain-containing protein [Sediminibacterium roseum]|uniref:DUF305 domain-containing protein n=1 Tax=Sediminibacterium roseum TaxID=1978412 RepID=A0ABW9ZQI0_9BACT|nr:DUF305 domain-containing protein [Sediminibacterium roseum]NCI49345.1 DUF305 domain-containing protein [Sediminibacterium roseum]